MEKKMSEIIVRDVNGKEVPTAYGTTAGEALEKLGITDKSRILAGVRVNNMVCNLKMRLAVNSMLEPVYLDSYSGGRIYRSTFCFLLNMVSKEIFPDRRLIIGNSVSNNYIFYYENIPDVSVEDLQRLEDGIRARVEENLPIEHSLFSYVDAERFFREQGMEGAALLIRYKNEPVININTCGSYSDLAHTPLMPSTGELKHFRLMCYHHGFLVSLPKMGTVDRIPMFKDVPVLTSIFQESREKGRILKFSNVGELNAYIAAGKERDAILMCEMMHNLKIAEAAARIKERHGVKVVLIAGPSSSGKTTFIKKLSTQLQLQGFNPLALSLDDYYVPRLQTPKNEKGEYDYECLEAIDIEVLNKDLLDFFEGKEIELPYYNFKTGLREYNGNRIKDSENSILLIEGIHGLNDRLTYQIPAECKFKIYISALTQMNLDDHNKIHTTDNRLLRRMIRDFKYRGRSAAETIKHWRAVREGEEKNIFPFQNNADFAFNSALDYELAVLKIFASPLLKSIKPDQREYGEARRLQALLQNFMNIQPLYVSSSSLLREFIGDSIYKY